MVKDVEVYYAVRKDVDVLDMNKTMAYTERSGNVSSAEGTLWSIVKGVEFRAAKTSVIDYHERNRFSAVSVAFLKCVWMTGNATLTSASLCVFQDVISSANASVTVYTLYLPQS